MDELINSGHLRETIRIIIRNLGVLEKDEASCCGVTIGQCHAIVENGRAGEISLNDLADLLNLDKSTMSRTVNNLVENDLVVRELDNEDRRYVKIKLTEKGYKAFKRIEETMEQYYRSVLGSIPENKRAQVMESLQLLLEALKNNKCC